MWRTEPGSQAASWEDTPTRGASPRAGLADGPVPPEKTTPSAARARVSSRQAPGRAVGGSEGGCAGPENQGLQGPWASVWFQPSREKEGRSLKWGVCVEGLEFSHFSALFLTPTPNPELGRTIAAIGQFVMRVNRTL